MLIILNIKYIMEKRLKMPKIISLTILIGLLLLSSYSQLTYADGIIKFKVDSYQEIKEVSLWLKENTEPDSIIYSQSTPYVIYYAERLAWANHQDFGIFELNETQFLQKIKDTDTNYILVSTFEMYPDWIYAFPEKYKLNAAYSIPNKVIIYDASPLLEKE